MSSTRLVAHTIFSVNESEVCLSLSPLLSWTSGPGQGDSREGFGAILCNEQRHHLQLPLQEDVGATPLTRQRGNHRGQCVWVCVRARAYVCVCVCVYT